jgi:hypothetical protein
MTDVISTAALPADVRAAGAEARQLYTAALGFEQTLVRTLASQLADTATNGDDGEEGGDAAAGIIRDQIPDALADGIASNGGLGLAHELYLSMSAKGAGK